MHTVAARADDPGRSAAPEGPSPRVRHRGLDLVTATTACAFASLAIAAHRVPYFPIGVTLTRQIQGIHGAWFVAPLAVLSVLGFPPLVGVLIATTIAVIFFAGHRAAAIAATFGAVGIAGLNFLTKALVSRPRPAPSLVEVAHHLPGSGFPAGHVMTFTVFLGFLGYLAVTGMPPSWRRTTLLAFLLATIVAMGPARIAAGEHWPSDVLGGYLLGLVWLIITIRFDRWYRGSARARSIR